MTKNLISDETIPENKAVSDSANMDVTTTYSDVNSNHNNNGLKITLKKVEARSVPDKMVYNVVKKNLITNSYSETIDSVCKQYLTDERNSNSGKSVTQTIR